MTNKKYQIIMADPPWQYDFSKDNADKIENHYPTMTLKDICDLKVPSDNNCVLYLWATAPKLLEALEVMKSWGFRYKTHAIWDKQGDRIYGINGKSVSLSALGGGRGAKTGPYLTWGVASRTRNGKKQIEHNELEKANAITTVQTDSMVDVGNVIRKFTPIECERLQSLPDNYTEGISNTQRYKTLGNGFNCAVIKHIIKSIL